jgi:UDP-N-acetylmuramyl pentapeptide synthase
VIPLTLAEIAQATGGTLHHITDPATLVTGPLSFDSRYVAAGGLFACLTGRALNGLALAHEGSAELQVDEWIVDGVVRQRRVRPQHLVDGVLDGHAAACEITGKPVVRRLPVLGRHRTKQQSSCPSSGRK